MKLLTKANIGRMQLKNRICFAPMGVGGLAGYNGELSQRGIDYYVERAKGGVALVRMGVAKTNRKYEVADEPVNKSIILDNRSMENWLSEVVERCHDYDAKISIQLMPGVGRIAGQTIQLQGKALSASENPCHWAPHIKTKALAENEIWEIIQSFEQTASLLKLAGFDAVELNGHEGYLLDQFMTPLWNRRTDQWGGTLNNRMRFAQEIIKTIKKGAGADFPVIFRFGLTHNLPGGRVIEEGLEIAQYLEDIGVSAIEVDAGCYENWYYPHPPTTLPQGCFLDLARITKQVVKIPVIAVGKLGDPHIAEQALIDEMADFIALGRPLLADPEWVNKVKKGTFQTIKPCIGCHEGCLQRIFQHKGISCAVNPRTGNEQLLKLQKTEKVKTVVVIGGGYAGMEASITASQKGYQVHLFESSEHLGGIFQLDYIPGFKTEFSKLTQYYTQEIANSDIHLHMNHNINSTDIKNINPDHIIIATGAIAGIPDIPGLERNQIVFARDAFHKDFQPDGDVLILGGGLVGTELAITLKEKAERILLVEQTAQLCSNAFLANKMHLIKLLEESHVEVHLNTSITSIENHKAIVNNGSEIIELPFGTFIIATGYCPNRGLLDSLEEFADKCILVGDCDGPGKVINAVWDAYRKVNVL